MALIRRALRLAAQAARANLLPGLLLQCLMLVFFSAYISHEGTRTFLTSVSRLKQESGYLFAFASYVLAGALLPELLRIAFFQAGRPSRRNLWLFLTAAPAWGCMGMLVDLFYRYQAIWFGTGHDLATLAAKVAVDQFVFSPFLTNPLTISWFLWRDEGFRASAWRKILSWDFLTERLFPVQVLGWIVWIPGVTLVYFMPSLLQIPVAVIIQVFWVLMFTTLGQRAQGGNVTKL